MVTIDVIAHQLGRGFTEKSSGLFLGGQSGGLNAGKHDHSMNARVSLSCDGIKPYSRRLLFIVKDIPIFSEQ